MNIRHYDTPLGVVLILVIIGASICFVGMMYDICVAMPDEWFISVISGIVIAVCLYFLHCLRE